MLTNGSAVPCRNRTGQIMRSSPAGTSTIDAGKEQGSARSCGSYLGRIGCEQRGQGSSACQHRRLIDPLQRRAQPVGSDRDDRMGAAPRGQLKGDPGTEGVPGDVKLRNAKPVQLPFNRIGQGRRRGRNPRGERR
jgi:hypothetical protein